MSDLDRLIARHAKLVANSAESYALMVAAQEEHRADRAAEREACESLDEAIAALVTDGLELGNYEPVNSSAGERLAKALKGR